MARVLPKDPELETEAEAYNTWHIKDWRKLKKKEHGPVFECGGAPWCVHCLGHSLPATWIVPNTLLGGYSSFLTATRLITLHFTSNKLGKRIPRRTGMHVYNSHWSCGM